MFLACLFQRKSPAIVIVLVVMQKLYSKSIKGIDIKRGIFAYHDKIQLQDKGKGHNTDNYRFGVMPLVTYSTDIEEYAKSSE